MAAIDETTEPIIPQLSKAHFALASLASTDPSRPALACLRLAGGQLLATDGRCAGMVDVPGLDALTPCSVAAADVRAIKTPMQIDVAESNQNGAVSLRRGGAALTVPKISEDAPAFPDVARVFPSGKPILSIGFNPELLARVLTVAAGLSARRSGPGPWTGKAMPRVTLHLFADDAPVKLTTTTADGSAAMFVVMPLRV